MSENRKAECTPFEDALDKTGLRNKRRLRPLAATNELPDQSTRATNCKVAGNGVYNVMLVVTCAWILLAIGVDLFGFSLVVASACDLELTVAQKGILTSLPFIGILLVSYVWGYVSDTRGRRFSLVLSLQAAFVLSCLTAVSPNWLFLGLVKFFSVCFSCAANSATYTLVGESCLRRVRSKYMLLMTCLLLLSPAAAAVLTYPTLKLDFSVELSWIHVVFRPWRLLIIVLAIPSGIGGLAIYFFHESPKFLANIGRNDDALSVMKSIYAVNHRCARDDFKVKELELGEEPSRKSMTLLRSMYEQSAPLFRPPLLCRTLQLFYIVGVVYITNNSFLVWLPQIFNLVMLSMESGHAEGNVCSLIAHRTIVRNLTDNTNTADTVEISPDSCLGVIEDNVILTLIASQSAFSFLNFIISYLPNHRKTVLLSILCLSSLSGVCCNLMPEPISSVVFFVLFTCTCLGMGILASYFVDLYPTSYRGMVACLSIMVGRSSTFIGINLVGNLIFNHCQITFYFWSLLVLSSVVAAWFLPPDKVKPEVKTTAI